jgi:diketogulonate reductase-like aldo/keto reductase
MKEIPSIKLNNDKQIPAIGFGTWQLSPQDAHQSVLEALKAGYRLIDTAKIYSNEEAVGKAINESGVPREEIFLTTKLWNSDQGYESAKKAFDESLSKLNQDFVDLYLIHWPGEGSQKRLDSWRALCEIYKQGRAKSIGVSNFTADHLKELFDSSDMKPTVNQVEFHPFIYSEQKDLVDFCHKHGIVFEAYSPLAQGHRSDPLLGRIGEKYHKSASQVMLRWAIQQKTVPLPRSANADHIKENFEMFDFELSAEDMKLINNLSDNDRQSWDPNNLP